jgi:hypothetical protein
MVWWAGQLGHVGKARSQQVREQVSLNVQASCTSLLHP